MITLSAGLIASYTALAVLLLAMLFYSRLHWVMKAAAVVLISAFYPVSYFSVVDLLGWPTAERLPHRFRLVAAEVVEPDKQQGSSGQIYLWVAAANENAGHTTPRAYSVNYSKVLHTKLDEAEKSLLNGLPQLGEVVEEQSETGLPAVAADLSRTSQVTKQLDIVFTPLATNVLPTK